MICRAYLIYSDHSDRIYIGSTELTTEQRLDIHTHHRDCAAKILIDLGDYDIIKLEEFECDTHKQKRIIEQDWMDCYPGMLVNINRAYRTTEQRRQQQKAHHQTEKYKEYDKKRQQKPENRKRANELQRLRREWKRIHINNIKCDIFK